MRHRKIRRFRPRSNDRGFQSRKNGDQLGLGPHSFSNGKTRSNFKSQQSVEKLAEKYSALGKEALSSGDRILSENYFQHADHFMRIIKERKSNQNQVVTEVKKTDIQNTQETAKAGNNAEEKK